MYANESKGEVFPPLSPIVNNWMMDMDAVYPEYVTDMNIFVCPSSPFDDNAFRLRNSIEHPGAAIGEFHPDCVWSLFYVYTGWMILFDDQAFGFLDAYYERPHDVLYANNLILDVPLWGGSGDAIGEPIMSAQSGIPIMWDRVPLDDREYAHVPMGCNVLYMDGHVEFQRYADGDGLDHFPVSRGSAEVFGSTLPHLSQDCYAF
jgi:prepilin-type processing-associated H-X9-DG protein